MELPVIDAIAGKAREADGNAAVEFEVYYSWTRQVVEAAEQLGITFEVPTETLGVTA